LSGSNGKEKWRDAQRPHQTGECCPNRPPEVLSPKNFLLTGSAAYEEAQKKKKKRRRGKKKGATGDNGAAAAGGNASDDSDGDDEIVQAKDVTPPAVPPPIPPEGHGLDPMVHLVAECCRAGFTKEEVRSTIDEMWENNQPYDDPEAVIRALKQKKSAVKRTTITAHQQEKKAPASTPQHQPSHPPQTQTSKKVSPSSPKRAPNSPNGHVAPAPVKDKSERKKTEAPVTTPAPSTVASKPAVVEQPSEADAKSSREAALEQAASHDSVEDALAALVGWTHLAPPSELKLFFQSHAPELLLQNILEHSLRGASKNYPSCLRDSLSQLLTRLLGPGVVAGPLADLLSVIRNTQVLNSRHKLSKSVVTSLAKVLASYLRNFRTQADVAGAALTEIPTLKARIAANTVAGRGANKASRHGIPIRDLFMLRDAHHEAASLYHVGVRLLWNPFQQVDPSAEENAVATRLAISQELLQDVLDTPASAIKEKRKEVSLPL